MRVGASTQSAARSSRQGASASAHSVPRGRLGLRPLREGSHGSVDRREDTQRTRRLGHAASLEPLAHRCVGARDGDDDAALRELRRELLEHLERRAVDLADALEVEHHPLFSPRVLLDHRREALAETCRVREEQRRVEAVDEQALGRLEAVAVGLHPTIEALRVREDRVVGQRDAAERQQDRRDHGDEHTVEHVEDHHRERARDGDCELRAAQLVQAAEAGHVDDRDGRRQDHGGERGLGHEREHRAEAEHAEQHEARGDEADELRLAAERGGHRRATGARRDREATGERRERG
jgi:hypothetical protein